MAAANTPFSPLPAGAEPVHGRVAQKRLPELMTPRGQHVPSWYDPSIHADPENPAYLNSNLIVRDAGIPIVGVDGEPFSIVEVPVERRWAVKADGDILDQFTFQQQYVKRIEDYYHLAHIENPKVRYQDNPNREPVPNVRAYVSEQVDPDDERRVIPMHYRNHTRGSKPETLLGKDGDGQEIEVPRISALTAAYMDPKARGAMKPHEIEEVEAEMRRMVDSAAVIGDPDVRDQARRDSKKSSAKGSRRGIAKAPCGEDVPNFSMKRHVAECPKCPTPEEV